MNMYRRNNFKSWFADVGFLYVIVSLLAGLSVVGLALVSTLGFLLD